MTGSYDGGEEESHLTIHFDAGDYEAPPPAEAETQPAPPPFLQRYRYWLLATLAVVIVSPAAYGIGAATYDPPSRLPRLDFGTEDGLYGTNAVVASEHDVLRRTFSDPQAVNLEPAGTVFELPLPRTVADRLFDKRDESARIFSARSPAGTFKFLVLMEGDETRFVATEGPFDLGGLDQPTGVFLALDPADAAFGPMYQAVEALLPSLKDQETVRLSPDSVYIFGPYQSGDAESVRARIEANAVMAHLTRAIDASDGGVSVAAPVFLVAGGPSRGTINAVYHPARKVVMEPLWGESSTSSLAHELVHAYLDTVEKDRPGVLANAANYLEHAHPVLHGQVVGDLYQRLSREGRAEESLAFIAGAIAAGQTKTVSSQLLLENPGNLQVSEAIFYSDVGLLIQIGVLPPCMLPNEGADGEITPAFYERAEEACEE